MCDRQKVKVAQAESETEQHRQKAGHTQTQKECRDGWTVSYDTLNSLQPRASSKIEYVGLN